MKHVRILKESQAVPVSKGIVLAGYSSSFCSQGKAMLLNPGPPNFNVSYALNSVKGAYTGDYIGERYRAY